MRSITHPRIWSIVFQSFRWMNNLIKGQENVQVVQLTLEQIISVEQISSKIEQNVTSSSWKCPIQIPKIQSCTLSQGLTPQMTKFTRSMLEVRLSTADLTNTLGEDPSLWVSYYFQSRHNIKLNKPFKKYSLNFRVRLVGNFAWTCKLGIFYHCDYVSSCVSTQSAGVITLFDICLVLMLFLVKCCVQ